MTPNKINKDSRINFLDIKGKIFYKYIYPMTVKEFYLMKRFDDYYRVLNAKFVLNDDQWEEVLMQWQKKERRKGL